MRLRAPVFTLLQPRFAWFDGTGWRRYQFASPCAIWW